MGQDDDFLAAVLEVSFEEGSLAEALRLVLRLRSRSGDVCSSDRRRTASRRLAMIAEVARECLKAVCHQCDPSSRESLSVDCACDVSKSNSPSFDRSSRETFCRLFEGMFRRVVEDLRGEDPGILTPGEAVGVSMLWRTS